MTSRPLTQSMQAELIRAYLGRRLHGGMSVLACRPQTARALISRRLATRHPELGPILTSDGEITAESLINATRPDLQRADLVLYHGIDANHFGREFIVLAPSQAGEYSMISTDSEAVVMQSVPRACLTYTGESALVRYPDLIGTVNLPHDLDVQVATGHPQVNAYRRALWQERRLAEKAEVAHRSHDECAKRLRRARKERDAASPDAPKTSDAHIRVLERDLGRSRTHEHDLNGRLHYFRRELETLRAHAEQASPAAAARARLSIVAHEEATAAEQRRYERAAAAGGS